MSDLLQPKDLLKRSSLQLGLRIGVHLVLTVFHLEDLSELSHMVLP